MPFPPHLHLCAIPVTSRSDTKRAEHARTQQVCRGTCTTHAPQGRTRRRGRGGHAAAAAAAAGASAEPLPRDALWGVQAEIALHFELFWWRLRLSSRTCRGSRCPVPMSLLGD